MPRYPFVAIAAALTAAGLTAQSFVNYESPLVSPLRLSADGLRLFAAHTADNRLAVYSLQDPSAPVLMTEIPVGLEPVSVNPRTDDEVWVVNHLSDSVSIVSLTQGRVVATLQVADEPSDVVFAAGKAFVSAAASDSVAVFDAATRAPLGTVAIFGKDPRALAVNAAGTRVYAVVQRSGNGTTLIPEQPAPPQPPPTNTSLPAPPNVGLIVLATDPAWTAQIPYTLPDNDVVEIDTTSLAVTRNFRAVGTTNTGIAVDTVTGDLWVANTNARNLVHFEPNLRGHAIDSRLTRIQTGVSPTVTPIDLNPGLDYATLPNPTALGTALSEPYGVAIDQAAGRIYVAAQGTDRVGVLDLAGNVLARIEMSGTAGAVVDTANKRGPRALALLAPASRLYVLEKLSATIAVVDTASATVVRELPLGSFDPTPAAIRLGRKFLYDAKLSGNGTMSCASCHIDGDMDGVAWDLGDPGGNLAAPPSQPSPFFGLTSFHPMKGPMTTQTLKGLGGTGPLHWRGDRADFQAFNGAFASLLGGSPLSVADMNAYAAFGVAIGYPPNPNQPKNRSYLTTPSSANQQAGATAFGQAIANLPIIGNAGCFTCHPLPKGTGGMIINNSVIQSPQQMKAPQLRNLYRKQGFSRTAGPQKSGFGFTHDGALDNLTNFLALPQFNSWPTAVKDDLVQFLLAFDTGTAPITGFQVTLDQQNAGNAQVNADLDLLIARAQAGDIDLVAHGSVQGTLRGLRFDTALQTFTTDTTGTGPFGKPQLLALAQAGNAALTFTGVPPGSGVRIGIDRDLDGQRDGDEAVLRYGIPTAGCAGVPTIDANGEPRLGNASFAVVGQNVPALAFGLFGLGFAPIDQPLLGIHLLTDITMPGALIDFVSSDARGAHAHALPVPAAPIYANLHAYAQFAWSDPCGPQGLSASAALDIGVRPQ